MLRPSEKTVTGEVQSERMSRALHDLCQPLTILQCRLELAELAGTPEAYREAVRKSRAECTRLLQAVDSLRAAADAMPY